MRIQLPSVAEVAHAVQLWSAEDTRLGLLLARYGQAAPALRHYGLVLWEGGQLQSASQALTGAAALAPEDARVWNDLASVFSALGAAKEAAACATESLTREPTQLLTWMQLGAIQNTLGDGVASAEAYRKALSGDQTLVDAWVGLGLAYLSLKRFRDAITPFQESVRRGKADDPAVQGCLGQALDAVGDFKGAAATFAIACRLDPGSRPLLLKMARAQFVVDAVRGTAEDAVAGCTRLGLTEAEIEKTARDAFHLLSAYEYRHAAINVGEWRLSQAPQDRMQAYLLKALKGEAIERAPDGYIVTFFDRFADEFDEKLVSVLNYRVPGDLADLVDAVTQPTGRALTRVLDLGCGTGLAGPCFARPGRTLTGVDLSPRMLDKARLQGCYTSLIEAEVVGFLTNNASRYDLIVAADVLIYFGDLTAIFAGVARALEPDGLFALSIETTTGRDIEHLSSGRFAHGQGYIARVAAEAGLTIVERRDTTIRLEAKAPAIGSLLLMTR